MLADYIPRPEYLQKVIEVYNRTRVWPQVVNISMEIGHCYAPEVLLVESSLAHRSGVWRDLWSCQRRLVFLLWSGSSTIREASAIFAYFRENRRDIAKGRFQPKVGFYTLKSPKLAPIALPRYLNSIFLISDLCTMLTPFIADKQHIQKAI